jgi:hypothetical protein
MNMPDAKSTNKYKQNNKLDLKITDRDGNIIYANYNRTLDVNNTIIHSKIYNYLKQILISKQETNIINDAYNIGFKINDKILILANLFYLCVRNERISLMQRIIQFVKSKFHNDADQYISFIINGYDRNYTPMMRAANKCSLQSMRLLLVWGANIHCINPNGEDVLAAAKYGYETRCNNFPEYEIFETKKYNEITKFIAEYKTELNNTIENELIIESNILNNNDDIDQQVETIIIECLENTNEYKLIKFFEELKQNNIKVPLTIISKYEQEIASEFTPELLEKLLMY